MKLKVLFIDKKELKVTLTLCLSLIIFLVLINNIFSPDKDVYFHYNDSDTINIQKDFNGDGKKDLLQVEAKDNKYNAKIISKNKTYNLIPNKKLNSLGTKYSFSNVILSFCDLSRDHVPEIFICSYENDTPIFHIFSYDNKNFNDIFCSTNNMYGVLESKNNKTPKLFSFSLMSAENKSSFILLKDKLKNISYENYTIPSLSEIQAISTYILSDYTPDTYPDIFYNVDEDSLLSLINLDKTHYGYSFLYGNFIDNEWNKKGDITKISWDLYFKKSSNENSKDVSTLNVKLTTEKVGDIYKVTSIKVLTN